MYREICEGVSSVSYTKQNFLDGDVLTAAQLNHIEEGIAAAFQKIKEMEDGPVARLSQVTLFSSEWTGENELHSQVVTIDGITEYSKVDLLPSVEQLAIFHNKDVAFVTENEDGVVTVFAIGDKPTQDYTMQVSITEVVV